MDDRQTKLPLVALRGLVMFPNSVLSFEVGSASLVETIEKATKDSKLIFLTAPLNPNTDDPSDRELYKIGTVSEVKKVIRIPGEAVRIIAQGIHRGRIERYVDKESYLEVEISYVDVVEDTSGSTEALALIRAAKETFEHYARLNGKIPPEITIYLSNLDSPAEIADIIASNLPIKFKEKQKLLETLDCTRLLQSELVILNDEITIMEHQIALMQKVKQNMEQTQKDYHVREQIKVLQEELGEKGFGADEELRDYQEKINALAAPEQVLEKLAKEFSRLKRISGQSQEAVVIRDYMDWVLELPWEEKSQVSEDLMEAERILNRDHYGLVKVKERIMEYLAVRQNTANLDAPILCLVGPPGVGKTSIAKSIATALGRKYIRMSLGGVRDEAEIRGHRKTYIGAMPGRIINSMKQAGVNNPLILLDEIDKLSSDYKGDPSSALLEVLDQEQNFSFRDHYIELPYDLSDTFFICTANSAENIPAALKDRLELVELNSYTKNEKEAIGMNFLVPKQMEKHGIHSGVLQIDPGAISDIVEFYTKEAGVRQLERLIAKICRKTVKATAMDGVDIPVLVNSGNLAEFLGNRRFKREKKNSMPEVGVVRGLAWTSVGGDTLSVEVNCVRGKGKFKLTGNVGKVMKESALAAISYVRTLADRGMLGIDGDFYKSADIHIHIPEGATPKDGPSAGITMAAALLSALTGRAVDNDLAMTGEITIRGRVLPIGGLKEKLLAAKSAGIHKVLIPYENEGDLKEIEEEIKEGMDITLVRHMDEVAAYVFAESITGD